MDELRGKRLPALDRVEISPIEDEQPRYLAFLNREHDILDETPFAFIHQVLPNGKLSVPLARQGVRVFRELQPEITYDVFNVEETGTGKPNPVPASPPTRAALRPASGMAP